MTLVTDKMGNPYCSSCHKLISDAGYCQYCEIHKLRAELATVRQTNLTHLGLLKECRAELVKEREAWESIKTARQVMYDAPELNMSNYDHDQVAELNTAMCEAFGIIDTAVRQLKED